MTGQRRPLLTLRCPKHGCFLAACESTPAGIVVAATRSFLASMLGGSGGTTRIERTFTTTVDDGSWWVPLGCKHYPNLVVDAVDLRSWVRTAKRGGVRVRTGPYEKHSFFHTWAPKFFFDVTPGEPRRVDGP